jgi:predicted component of type VI protein secretion system
MGGRLALRELAIKRIIGEVEERGGRRRRRRREDRLQGLRLMRRYWLLALVWRRLPEIRIGEI